MTRSIQNLSIIGCGQVGASILLAMAHEGKNLPTTVYDPNPEVEAELRTRFAELQKIFPDNNFDSLHITFTSSIAEAVAAKPDENIPGADLIILAAPMGVFKETSREIAKHAKAGTILTDTGSAKKVASENIKDGTSGYTISYVAAHNSNGGQGAGPSTGDFGNILGSNSTMFLISEEGKDYIPPENSPEDVVQNFWKERNVTTEFITTKDHDEFFGQCSHFQHAVNIVLASMAKDYPECRHNFKYAGTALRNMFRILISPIKEGEDPPFLPMWLPIFEQNKLPIIEAHSRFKENFGEFIGLAKSKDSKTLKEKLQAAQLYRDSFINDDKRREIITGEIDSLREMPKFCANDNGQLSSRFQASSMSALTTNLILPLAISYGQLLSAQEIAAAFIARKSNLSFRDGTHPSTYSPAYVIQIISSQSEAMTKTMSNFADDFTNRLQQFVDAIRDNNKHYIREVILTALDVRREMPEPRKNDKVREDYERMAIPK